MHITLTWSPTHDLRAADYPYHSDKGRIRSFIREYCGVALRYKYIMSWVRVLCPKKLNRSDPDYSISKIFEKLGKHNSSVQSNNYGKRSRPCLSPPVRCFPAVLVDVGPRIILVHRLINPRPTPRPDNFPGNFDNASLLIPNDA